jgi:MSHA biogenesis protein MshO
MRTRGFTLLELLVVIVITGILAATVSVFLTPAISSYFDARRRATLTDIADTALRRVARDVRSAVPNSVRIPNNQCFELVPTSGGGRYRMGPDTVNDNSPGCAPSATCSAPLNVAQPASVFDSLSPLSVTPALGDFVVIGNQNTNDVYAGTDRAAIIAPGVTVPNAAFGQHRISIASTQFPSGYSGGRFVIVPNNGGNQTVFYVCNGAGLDAQGNGTGTLNRLTRAFTAAYPAACPVGGAVLATRVRSCNFVYSANQGATQQSGFVWMQVDLTEANETVSLSHGAHVDNVP